MSKRANNNKARQGTVRNRSFARPVAKREKPSGRMLTIECLEDRLVLSAAPPIMIDGNFDDWDTADYAGGTDPAGDPHDTDHNQENDVPALVDHPDVDLLEYRVTHDAENLYFYFRAAGEIGRTQDSSTGGRAGRYYVIVTIDVDDDVVTGYPLHEGGYYPTTDGYDMNAEIEFYDGEFNTGHYLNHGALDEDELYQAFLDQTSGEYVPGNDGPYTPGFVNVLPGTYEYYTQWVYQDNGTATDTDDQIILVRDKGPVVPGIVSYALSADGHELEMRAPLKGFLVDQSGTPIINVNSIINLSFSLEASGELANGTPQNPNGEWASDTADPILDYSMYYNAPPMVALANTITELPENTDTSSRVKVADIVVTDDGEGTNDLSLTGADAGLFEIDGTELYLKANTVLDSGAMPILSVTVNVDDAAVGTTPDSTVSLVINVTPFINTRPVADAGGPYVLGNRDRIRLDGSGSYDVDQPANTLNYLWDFDNDGRYDDAVGVRPYFTAADLNGQSNAIVHLKVVDNEGAYRTDVVRVYGEDTAVLRIRGDSKGVVSQRRVISLKLYGPTVTHEKYTYTVDWGDGSKPRVVTGISGLSISKRYNKSGNFTIRATAVSKETGLVTSHSRVMHIGSQIQNGRDFVVSGTNGDDYFRVFTRPGTDQVEIYRNRVSLGVHTVPGTVYAMGLGGDDWFVGDRGTYDVYFDGGKGENVSYTYGGDDTILGGDGRDRIYDYGGDNDINAGDGDNRITTGSGNDYIRSGRGNDKIIDTGGNNRIDAGDGNNYINTRRGNDVIITGSGQDHVSDVGGNNHIEVGDGSNVVRTGAGRDTIIGGAQDDNIYTNGANTLDPYNYIYTFAGNDFIVAYGNSYIDSGPGDDFVISRFSLFDDNDNLFDLLAKSR